MKSASELIVWYWKMISRKPYDEPCQCSTEKLIERSSNPSRMRAFIMSGTLVDQVMRRHFRNLYNPFREKFKFPQLMVHGFSYGDEWVNPNWVAYTSYGWDKKVDWNVVSQVSEVLLNSLYDWFEENNISNEMKKFQEVIKEEIDSQFEPVNKDKLLPIIERIKRERP